MSNSDENRKKRLEHKIEVTKRISETSRVVGFALVAWTYAMHISDKKFTMDYLLSFEICANIAGFAGILTIIFDYLQYVFAYKSIGNALKRETENYSFDNSAWSYKCQNIAFWGKQIAAIIGSVIVAITFAIHIAG